MNALKETLVMILYTLGLPAALLAIACGAKALDTGTCTPAQEAAIEAEYVSEAVAACKAEGATSMADCKVLPEIRIKYQAKRSAWVECTK